MMHISAPQDLGAGWVSHLVQSPALRISSAIPKVEEMGKLNMKSNMYGDNLDNLATR